MESDNITLPNQMTCCAEHIMINLISDFDITVVKTTLSQRHHSEVIRSNVKTQCEISLVNMKRQ